jgi:acid phosphatase (class A)
MNRLLLLSLTLVAWCVAPLRAAETPYLAAHAVDTVALLAVPPVPGTAENSVDLETAFRVYSSATPADHAEGVAQHKLSIFHYASVIGPWFKAGQFPKTEALFKEVEAETKAFTDDGKKHWQRLRPYQADAARFPHAIEHATKPDYSYPSGHSTRGTVFALVLAELFPDKRDALVEFSRHVGWLRVEGGVHYPTDIYAGRVLGQAIVRELLRSDAFQRDLASARAELQAAQKG